ncbi:ATP-grasp peptide maturase system methyltransferase [Streptomyces buecherae]|uniref:Protein-L-isoaspartate O-methyltransferase n=1 Tax=Streptomyces buecherae TaxID=2763006 RepID=A0A7H8NBZ0_9ACTN|nr:ATP-grasp peptide maturase system methyltransferase [Streptomyces buecherae]QKW51288.1 methyltransferase domain-containing protein [Streptomyces buecherae]
MIDATLLRRALADEISAQGSLTDPGWRSAVEAVPREAFLGDAVYRIDHDERGTVYASLRRDQLPTTDWLALAYTNDTQVTQVAGVDAGDASGPVCGLPTSSATLPSLVVRMLEAAAIGDGERVLEIGTGTGYSTALLCHRLGSENVTSIEVDPAVARRARSVLHSLGLSPTLVVGDGLEGHQEGAEYDRIVATCSVRTIPHQWLWQARAGGTITTALGGWAQASGLVHLTAHADGTATGRFTGEAISYMLARPHQSPSRASFFLHDGEQRSTHVDPQAVWSWTGRFLTQLAAPSAELLGGGDRVILLDVATGSQAWTEPVAGGGWVVHSHGPLPLWRSVEDAFTQWERAGRPEQSQFGMTVTSTGQRVWMNDPEAPGWFLPC